MGGGCVVGARNGCSSEPIASHPVPALCQAGRGKRRWSGLGDRCAFVVPILIVLVVGVSDVAANVAAARLPEAWEPYLWIAWPVFFVCLAIGVGRSIWLQRAEQ
jgi:hypothetical protein